jgi:hydroxymethylglutaryl-CoA lyase
MARILSTISKNVGRIPPYIERVNICDVTLRDGIQGLKTEIIQSKQKVNMINLLSDIGYDTLEIASISKLPQMVNSVDLYKKINRYKSINYSTLVMNSRAFNNPNVLLSEPNIISTVVSPSPEFTKANMNRTVDEMIEDSKMTLQICKINNIKFRLYVSTAFTCSLSKKVYVYKLIEFLKQFDLDKIDEIAISDTTASATPSMIIHLINDIKKMDENILNKVWFHLHENNNSSNTVYHALKYGARNFDTTFVELGGCPSAGLHKNLHIDTLLNSISKFNTYGESNLYTHINRHKLSHLIHYFTKMLGRVD